MKFEEVKKIVKGVHKIKKFLQPDSSTASDRVYAALVDLRSNGIFMITRIVLPQKKR
jgi:hypothetical protein